MSYLKALQKGFSDSLVKEQVSLTRFNSPLPTLVDKGKLAYCHLQTTQYGNKNGIEISFGTIPPPKIMIKNPESGKMEEVPYQEGSYQPKAYLKFFGRYKNGLLDGWCVSFDHNKNMTYCSYGSHGMEGLYYADRTDEHPTELGNRNAYEVEKVERYKRKQEWLKKKEEETKQTSNKNRSTKKNQSPQNLSTEKTVETKSKKIDISAATDNVKEEAEVESDKDPRKSKTPTSREYKLSSQKYGPLIGRYHQGHRHGIWFLVDPNGDDVFVTRYDNGKDVTDYYQRDNVWSYQGMIAYLRKWDDYNKLGYYTDFQRRAIKVINRAAEAEKKGITSE